MILCDTNILIEEFKNNQEISAELRRIGRENLAVSVSTVAKLYFGAFDKRVLRQLQEGLAALQQIPISVGVSQVFINLMETYSLSHRLGIPDAAIAATALTHDVPLYTLNLKDFRFIPELQIHQPVR